MEVTTQTLWRVLLRFVGHDLGDFQLIVVDSHSRQDISISLHVRSTHVEQFLRCHNVITESLPDTVREEL